MSVFGIQSTSCLICLYVFILFRIISLIFGLMQLFIFLNLRQSPSVLNQFIYVLKFMRRDLVLCIILCLVDFFFTFTASKKIISILLFTRIRHFYLFNSHYFSLIDILFSLPLLSSLDSIFL